MKFPDVEVGKRLFVGVGDPSCLGIGTQEIRGAAYIEGPTVIGDPEKFPTITATCMIGPVINTDSPEPVISEFISSYCGQLINHSPYSLSVVGDAVIYNELDVIKSIAAGGEIKAAGSIKAQKEVESFCGDHKLSRKKNFDISHPTKDGWRLTHSCIEGPEAAVYIRGRTNKNIIELPEYWTKLVDIETITVSLTPVGAHQDLIVKRIGENKIYLQSKGGMPIDCFYHIFGERSDTEKLIPEYKGTIEDYPGDNTQRSIVGYHYDTK